MEVVKKQTKIKLAILLYSKETEPEKAIAEAKQIAEHLVVLQVQLNKLDNNFVEVLHNSLLNLSVEEKKEWLLSQTTSPKYVFITSDTVMEDNFIILRYNAVKLKKSTIQLAELGVYSK